MQPVQDKYLAIGVRVCKLGANVWEPCQPKIPKNQQFREICTADEHR